MKFAPSRRTLGKLAIAVAVQVRLDGALGLLLVRRLQQQPGDEDGWRRPA